MVADNKTSRVDEIVSEVTELISEQWRKLTSESRLTEALEKHPVKGFGADWWSVDDVAAMALAINSGKAMTVENYFEDSKTLAVDIEVIEESPRRDEIIALRKATIEQPNEWRGLINRAFDNNRQLLKVGLDAFKYLVELGPVIPGEDREGRLVYITDTHLLTFRLEES